MPSDRIQAMRTRLALLSDIPPMDDEALLKSELDVMRVLDQADQCGGCAGFKQCEYGGMVGKLDEWCGGVRYVVAGPCKGREKYLADQKAAKILESSRLPREQVWKRFDNFAADTKEKKELVKMARDVVVGNTFDGVYFCGLTGVGKTHLACAMLNLWNEKFGGGVYVSTVDLMEGLKDFEGGGKRLALLDLMKNADFLLLDDLGAERPKEWALEQLFLILNHRSNEARSSQNKKGKVTIITSNYDLPRLEERLYNKSDEAAGMRIISRIAGMCKTVEMTGKDWRVVR